MRSMSGLSRFAKLLTAFILGVLLSGCVVEESPAVSDPSDVELVLGREIYVSNCSSCHGSAGQGAIGTQLSGGRVLRAYPDVEDQTNLINEGRGSMPAFQARLSAEEIDAVVRYTREVIASQP